MFHLSLISGYRLVQVCAIISCIEKCFHPTSGLSLVFDGFAVLVFVMESSLDLKYQQDHMHKSSCLLYHKKADCLVFLLPIMCVCDLVGYQNQVYNVRILELWFSTLITCGNYLGNIKKCWYLGATLPSFIWLVWGVAWASVPLSDVILTMPNEVDKVERLYSRDSFWTYSVQIYNSFCHFFKLLKILVIVITLIWIF